MNKVKELTSVQQLASLQRPCFSPGLLLQDEDLTTAVTYTRDLVRLMVRSLFGCGVVCGLAVSGELTCNRRKLSVTVDAGVALDCAGNPIEVAKSQNLVYDPACDRLPRYVYVVLCYIEKCCRPQDVSCSGDDPGSLVMTRARSGFELRLYEQPPECACSCEPVLRKTPPPTDACCAGSGDSTATSATPRQPESHIEEPKDEHHCKCYDDHNKGICACSCGCNCVLIARIDTVPRGDQADETVLQPTLEVYEGMRRWVRPVLTGYLPCLEHRCLEHRSRPEPPDSNDRLR